MPHLIDKDALVAEIENIRKHYIERDDFDNGWNFALDKIISLVDTLEVKEVDLEQEIQNHIKECLDVKFPTTDVELIKKDVAYTARRFFELGLAQKGE